MGQSAGLTLFELLVIAVGSIVLSSLILYFVIKAAIRSALRETHVDRSVIDIRNQIVGAGTPKPPSDPAWPRS